MPDVRAMSQLQDGLMTTSPDITIRRADARDAESIARLAALDSTRPPSGVVVLAERGSELWAAISTDDGHVAADPFRPSAASAHRLRDHVAAVSPSRRREALRRRLRSVLGPVQPNPRAERIA
jgi:hypothetical protein